MPDRRLRFNAFTMNCVSHIHHGQWVRQDTRQMEYAGLQPWVELAQLLERGKFDALFLADVIGTYDSYGGSRDAAVEEGLQIPLNDPSLLIPAMAYATSDLGFAFTHSVLQEHPFNFARRVSTLDHLTNGRVAWNIVTSYLENAARNLGYGSLPVHEDRYRRAQEYVTVLYKLLEGSWEDDAVVRDLERGIYADPARIHDIDHVGEFYNVVGPHLSEPSLQRTPVLFQAGSSEQGRNFAARNAEAIFIIARSPEAARTNIEDVRARALRAGRDPEDLLFFQGLSFVVGGTEQEAWAKAHELEETASARGYAAHMGGGMGVDLAEIDLDTPIGELERYNTQGIVKGMIETSEDKTWTFGDLLMYRSAMRIVGTPEQIADQLQRWADAGVDGINVSYYTTPGSFEDFIEGVTPVLQQRGLQQREYTPGTLREKLTDGASGPRLNDRHPAAEIRRKHLRGVQVGDSAAEVVHS
ncbi:MAG TPA: LLM class flavin-dependent oxidoreductase [Solirubrobacteraceae bacterium]|jgi:FMN-dependent oxidoreductase (nitrilotriacetate monooxygenase family)|nr:LLM class flavin-dependent oxidoreductase [Solirubrobacteraceae bacterium]